MVIAPMKRRWIPLLLLVASAGILPASGQAWTSDFDRAVAMAADTDKPVMVLFTGSDWCGFCQRLEATVLSTQAFQDFAGEHLILMVADFPRKKLPEKIAYQNERLQRKYGINAFPTVVILDKEEQVLGRIRGYGGWSAESYINRIRAAIEG